MCIYMHISRVRVCMHVCVCVCVNGCACVWICVCLYVYVYVLFCTASCIVLQCVTVCCRVLQCVAVCCSVLQCVAECCRVLQCVAVCCSVLQCVAVCCSVLQCVAVCCSVLHVFQCVAVCRTNGSAAKNRHCSLRGPCVAVCFSVLQCVAICRSWRRLNLKYLDLQMGQFSCPLFWVPGTPVCSNENLFSILRTPVKTLAVVIIWSPISSVCGCSVMHKQQCSYGVATVSRIDQIIGLFCRIASLL